MFLRQKVPDNIACVTRTGNTVGMRITVEGLEIVFDSPKELVAFLREYQGAPQPVKTVEPAPDPVTRQRPPRRRSTPGLPFDEPDRPSLYNALLCAVERGERVTLIGVWREFGITAPRSLAKYRDEFIDFVAQHNFRPDDVVKEARKRGDRDWIKGPRFAEFMAWFRSTYPQFA